MLDPHEMFNQYRRAGPMMFTTRDRALRNEQITQAHLNDCGNFRREVKEDIADIKKDLNTKHNENKAEFQAIREAASKAQSKMTWGVISILGSIVGKIIFDSFHFQIHIGP